MTSFHAEKCCYLVSESKASARRLSSSVCQFLIYSTFVLVWDQLKLQLLYRVYDCLYLYLC